MNLMDLKVNKGDTLTHEMWNYLVDLLAQALEPPETAAPLVVMDGAICLAQDYQVYIAKTTGTIGARVSTTWGSGTASFLTVNTAGVEVTMPGFATFTAWNFTGGSIASGIRIGVVWAYDRWLILNADCSGVA